MKTSSDAVIEEIRESRRRMSEQAGHDPARYIEYLKSFNRKYAAQVARFRKRSRKPIVSCPRRLKP